MQASFENKKKKIIIRESCKRLEPGVEFFLKKFNDRVIKSNY